MTKSRTLRRAGAVALSLAMAMSIVGVTPASAAAKKVTLSKAKGTIKVGKTATVKIKGTKKANVKKVTFKYSKKNIVKATWKKKTSLKFTVKGLKKGTSTVKATIQLKKKVGKKKKYTLKYVATVQKAATTPSAAPSAEPAGPTDLSKATQFVLSKDGTTLWAVVDGKLMTVDLTKSGVTADQIKKGGTFDLIGADGNRYTLTLSAEDAAKITESDQAPIVAGDIKIVSAEIKTANTIEVTFQDQIVSTEVDVKVTKGGNAVAAEVKWDATFKVATITTASKLDGKYTITVTSTKDATKKDSKDVEATAQYVKEIIIKENVALTGKKGGNGADKDALVNAFAYYDVLDQYGESMRASTSIQWSGSAKIEANKTNGQLKITKTDGSAWVYNDKIYVVGVYSKTGVTINKELTVGTEQAVDSITFKGFVKTGTTAIVESLPKNFKANEYKMLFTAYDQNGNEMDQGSADGNLTFVSENVLVVEGIGAIDASGTTIEGVTYESAPVKPGIKVSDGGSVSVTAIASKTGKKSALTFSVGVDAVVASVALGSPSGTVADGETVEIPFTAKDSAGNEITSFDTLAKQKTFNTLSFNSSVGTLKLVEQKDGTAKLYWEDTAVTWNDTIATDGIDRPVSLTSIVVGGETSNQMITISDKRRPDAIAAVKMDEVYTEGAPITFSKNTFKFYDQYGDAMGDWGADNGFFANDTDTSKFAASSDFYKKSLGIRINYAGSKKISYTSGINGTTAYGDKATNSFDKCAVILKAGSVTFTTATDIDSVATGEGFKFEIVKVDTPAADGAAEWEAVSANKFFGVTVVDIEQVKGFEINALNKFYTGSITGVTGDGIVNKNVTDFTTTQGNKAIPATYQQAVVVKGKYNGKDVTVPADYYYVEGNKLATDNGALGKNTITKTAAGLKVEDLYDKTSAKGTAKDASDTLKATIKNVNGGTKASRATSNITYKKLKTNAPEIVAGWAQGVEATVANDLFETVTIARETAITADQAKADITAANQAITALKTDVENKTPALTNKAGIQSAMDDVVAAQDPDTKVNGNVADVEDVYDTASIKVTISDQAPKATTISGVQEAYTLSPTDTEIASVLAALNAVGTIKVYDQYGVAYEGDEITIKANNAVEDAAGYKANNLKFTGNDSKSLAVEGAEIGDKFDITVSCGAATTVASKVTIGADTLAYIASNADGNMYRDTLLETLKS